MTRRAEPEVAPSLEGIRDIEVSTGRELSGWVGWAVGAVAVAMSLFHIWILVFRAIDPRHRPPGSRPLALVAIPQYFAVRSARSTAPALETVGVRE